MGFIYDLTVLAAAKEFDSKSAENNFKSKEELFECLDNFVNKHRRYCCEKIDYMLINFSLDYT